MHPWGEELYGLSSGAIDRWATTNHIERDARLLDLVREAAVKLFFLANKSQEQITDDYVKVSLEIEALSKRIAAQILALSALLIGPKS
jgi:hypothetical protein